MCEYHNGSPAMEVYDLEPEDVFDRGTVIDYHLSPANAFSSCLAYCQGKDAETMMTHFHVCACIKGETKLSRLFGPNHML